MNDVLRGDSFVGEAARGVPEMGFRCYLMVFRESIWVVAMELTFLPLVDELGCSPAEISNVMVSQHWTRENVEISLYRGRVQLV